MNQYEIHVGYHDSDNDDCAWCRAENGKDKPSILNKILDAIKKQKEGGELV